MVFKNITKRISILAFCGMLCIPGTVNASSYSILTKPLQEMDYEECVDAYNRTYHEIYDVWNEVWIEDGSISEDSNDHEDMSASAGQKTYIHSPYGGYQDYSSDCLYFEGFGYVNDISYEMVPTNIMDGQYVCNAVAGQQFSQDDFAIITSYRNVDYDILLNTAGTQLNPYDLRDAIFPYESKLFDSSRVKFFLLNDNGVTNTYVKGENTIMAFYLPDFDPTRNGTIDWYFETWNTNSWDAVHRASYKIYIH